MGVGDNRYLYLNQYDFCFLWRDWFLDLLNRQFASFS